MGAWGLRRLEEALYVWFGRTREVLPSALVYMSGFFWGEWVWRGLRSMLSPFLRACPMLLYMRLRTLIG